MSNQWPKHLYQGEELTLTEIARRCGISASGLSKRIHVSGMTLEEAVAVPRNMPELHLYCGEMLSLKEIAQRAYIPESTIRARMKKYGVNAQDAVDGDYSQGQYAWQGEWLHADEIAERAGVDAAALKSIMHNRPVSAEEAVEIIRQREESKIERKRKLTTAKQPCNIAEKLIGMIIAAPEITQHSPMHFSANTSLYEICVEIRGFRAAMTVKWRKTGTTSMIREYEISSGIPVQIRAVSA